MGISRPTRGCGRSSGVEHNLAKVRVESSNLFARSNWFLQPQQIKQGRPRAAFVFSGLELTDSLPSPETEKPPITGG